MAYFIYRSVTTTKYTKGETFHVFMRETNVSLEWIKSAALSLPTSEVGVLLLNYIHKSFVNSFLSFDKLSISHSTLFVKSF